MAEPVGPASDAVCLNLADYERLAAERLDPVTYGYYRSGAGDERTLERNVAAFGELRLLPRVLVDVSRRDLSTEVLGTRMPAPVVLAPTAFHKLAHPEGEIATARAAGHSRTVMCLSTLSNTTLEDVARAATGPLWFQLYVFRDRGLTLELVERAVSEGYGAILLTVDAPVLGRRETDVRNAFELPPGLTIASVPTGEVVAPEGESGLAAYFASLLDPGLDWDDLAWLVEESEIPVAVKGVHRPDDALRAAEAGAAGVVVSNHGARQLDTVPATIEILPAIADAVGDRVEILMDGGVRRGTDVVKALCLGARCVLVGRPALWALACGGEEGVRDMIGLLVRELDETLALCGASSLDALGPDLLADRG